MSPFYRQRSTGQSCSLICLGQLREARASMWAGVRQTGACGREGGRGPVVGASSVFLTGRGSCPELWGASRSQLSHKGSVTRNPRKITATSCHSRSAEDRTFKTLELEGRSLEGHLAPPCGRLCACETGAPSPTQDATVGAAVPCTGRPVALRDPRLTPRLPRTIQEEQEEIETRVGSGSTEALGLAQLRRRGPLPTSLTALSLAGAAPARSGHSTAQPTSRSAAQDLDRMGVMTLVRVWGPQRSHPAPRGSVLGAGKGTGRGPGCPALCRLDPALGQARKLLQISPPPAGSRPCAAWTLSACGTLGLSPPRPRTAGLPLGLVWGSGCVRADPALSSSPVTYGSTGGGCW